ANEKQLWEAKTLHIPKSFLITVGAANELAPAADNRSSAYAGDSGAVSIDSPQARIVVTTVEDVVDFAPPQTVAQLPGPDGRVSFREAVVASNNTPGPQTIAFAIPQSDWWLFTDVALLKLENGVFNITDDQTLVDFTTQTDFTGDTNPDGNEVAIYGLEPNGAGSPAIIVAADNCVIRGLDSVSQRGYGIMITGNNNRVLGCTISGPLFAAVYISGGFGGPPASANIVGGTRPNDGNVLSAGNSGVRIDGPATDNVVIGNKHLSGAFFGAEVRSAPLSGLFAINNRIGGPRPAERNLISGSGHYGEEGFPVGGQVSLQDAVGTIVQGNYIGTDATGTSSFGQIGPVGVEARNSTGTQILGNLIGTDVSGRNPIPNHAGVTTSFWPGSPAPSAVTIGGTGNGEGNRIAFSETIGVTVDVTARGITISANSIESNGALGIDLFNQSGGGVTPNDAGDGDNGG